MHVKETSTLPRDIGTSKNMSNKPIDIPADIGEYLRYEPDTGFLFWVKKTSPNSNAKAGDRAGSLKDRGYRQIKFKGKLYGEHRIAWFLHYGEQPGVTLDHINEIKDDNRISNLRNATHQEQIVWRSQVSKKSDLPRHVSAHGKRFQAQVTRDKKAHTIGTYATPEEAHQAALNWIKEYKK